jgi:hypothetical protein
LEAFMETKNQIILVASVQDNKLFGNNFHPQSINLLTIYLPIMSLNDE